ncbi:MAG TPA: hypothetical protein VJN43_19750 [Bryobacteraceae bacterium]|nr:hypothetical protein [Bryobacteraceae bacterium]
MRISRREFAGTCLTAALPWAGPAQWRVLDLGAGCALSESIAGFCRLGIRVCPEPDAAHGGLIAAGVGALTDSLARSLAEFVRGGGRLIFESAAGFGGFDAQREMLARHFQIGIGEPHDLAKQAPRVPYVDYLWPVKAKLRDFSRIIPVSAEEGAVIGTAGEIPMALRLGRLIFLGSPAGPALLAGDREARIWFRALVRALSGSGPQARFPISAQRRWAI